MKNKTNTKLDVLISIAILTGVIVFGIIGLAVLDKKSFTNQRICSYLGGLWERKATDPAHRCYTYEEFYK